VGDRALPWREQFVSVNLRTGSWCFVVAAANGGEDLHKQLLFIRHSAHLFAPPAVSTARKEVAIPAVASSMAPMLAAAPLAAAEEAAGVAAAAAAATAADATAAADGGFAEPRTLQTLVVLGGGGACFGFGAVFNPPHATFNWQYP
jgi:hypothetical protein